MRSKYNEKFSPCIKKTNSSIIYIKCLQKATNIKCLPLICTYMQNCHIYKIYIRFRELSSCNSIPSRRSFHFVPRGWLEVRHNAIRTNACSIEVARVTRARSEKVAWAIRVNRVDRSLPWKFAVRADYSRFVNTPADFRPVHLLIATSYRDHHSRSARFTICSTIFQKIASRQRALLHHRYRKFVWIFKQRASFTLHARSRRGSARTFSFFWDRGGETSFVCMTKRKVEKESEKKKCEKYLEEGHVVRFEYIVIFAIVVVVVFRGDVGHEERISRQMGNRGFNHHISRHAHRQCLDPVCPLRQATLSATKVH